MVYDETHPSHKVLIPKLNLPGAINTLEDGTEVPAPDLFFK